MKTALFSKVAAVLVLLAPLGAMLVAQPAAAQDAPPAWVPLFSRGVSRIMIIERFEMSGVLAAGNEVRFRMVGVPGGTGRVTVPGVLQNADMTETSPGVYELRHVLSYRDYPGAFHSATATLQARGTVVTAHLGGSASAPVRGAPGTVYERRDGWAQPRPYRDDRGPFIGDLSPSHGARVDEQGRTRISARFGDDVSGVDPGSVRLRVDGRDVTGASRIHGDEIRYREDLAPGRHVAEVIVRDRAGNVSHRSWAFVVSDHDRGYGYGYDRDYGYGYGQPYRW